MKSCRSALQCMYAADIVTGIIVLAVIGAVNYFWLFPQQIDAGKWISLALAVLTVLDVLISRISGITGTATVSMTSALIL